MAITLTIMDMVLERTTGSRINRNKGGTMANNVAMECRTAITSVVAAGAISIRMASISSIQMKRIARISDSQLILTVIRKLDVCDRVNLLSWEEIRTFS